MKFYYLDPDGGDDHDVDAIEVLSDLVDGFTEYASRAERQALAGRKYRVHLLWIHSLFALVMAPAFAMLGQQGLAAPAFSHIAQIPYAPISLATVLGIGGMVTGVGCIFLNRPVELIGLVFLGMFYATLAFGFGWSVIDWYTGPMTAPAKPAPYAPILYLHLTTIMAIHCGTLSRLIREQNRVARKAARRGD